MRVFLNKTYRFPKLYFTIALLVYVIAGCNSISSEQLYENSDSGISLMKSGNWNLAYFERSGVIVLEAEKEGGSKASARIEIHGSACLPTPPGFTNPKKEVELNIERIRILYNLDSVSLVQEPIEGEVGEYEVTKAIITIPTMSLPENSVENQMGNRDPSILQTIEIFAISDREKLVMVYLYKGNSEKINTEAERIVTSIQLTCSTQP